MVKAVSGRYQEKALEPSCDNLGFPVLVRELTESALYVLVTPVLSLDFVLNSAPSALCRSSYLSQPRVDTFLELQALAYRSKLFQAVR